MNTANSPVTTINFHFWDAVARYLHRKDFPIKLVTSTEEIVKIAQKILKTPEKYKMNTEPTLKKLESPAPIMVQYIEKFLEKSAAD